MQHHRIPLPRPARLAVLPGPCIADAIERLLAELDTRDVDADLEDSEAGNPLVDERGRYLGEIKLGFGYVGPEVEDAEFAWAEGARRDLAASSYGHEDAEDDDPLEANGDEQDCQGAEDEPICGGLVQIRPTGPGCIVSDPDKAVDDDGVDGESEDGV